MRSFSSGLTANSSVEELDLSVRVQWASVICLNCEQGNDLDENACLSLAPALTRLPLLSALNLSVRD